MLSIPIQSRQCAESAPVASTLDASAKKATQEPRTCSRACPGTRASRMTTTIAGVASIWNSGLWPRSKSRR